jgi:rod shape determining protein RodA
VDKKSSKKWLFWRKIDWWLVVPVIILLTLSVLTLSSLPVQGAGNLRVWVVQLLAICGGFILAWLVSKTNSRWWRQNSQWWYLIGVILLVVTLFWGTDILGARRWLNIGGGLELQVSEVAKLALALLLARFLSRPNLKDGWRFGGSVIYSGVVVILIFLQPDLDNALLLTSLLIILLVISGLAWRWLLILLVGMSLIGLFGISHLHSYQKQRLLSFTSQKSDDLGPNYNANQARIAIGSGGLTGEGIGGGSQSELKFLPSQSTDFIFAVVAEKLGFIGALAIILCLGTIVVRIWWLASQALQPYERLALVGLGWIIGLETLINIGMNVGLLPVSGIQLPLVSYGGTHVVLELIMLSLVIVMAKPAAGKQNQSLPTLQTSAPLLP